MKYILENEYVLAEITELGATLTKFIDKKSGIDIVLGFESDEEYLKYNGNNIGGVVSQSNNSTADINQRTIYAFGSLSSRNYYRIFIRLY